MDLSLLLPSSPSFQYQSLEQTEEALADIINEGIQHRDVLSSPVHTFPLNFEPPLEVSPFVPPFPNDSPVIEGTLVLVETFPRYKVFTSPNGSRLWDPSVDTMLEPVINTSVADIDAGIAMYKKYAFESGFNVRIGQGKTENGVLLYKYLRCSKSGKPKCSSSQPFSDPNTKIRNSTQTMRDCKAYICFKGNKLDNTMVVNRFNSYHNHALFDDFNRDLTKTNRQLVFSTQKFIHDMAVNKVGPQKAHRYMVSLRGGHHNVNGTPTDWKNYSTTARIYIGDNDAQLLLERFRERVENTGTFFFEHLAKDGKLNCIFWVDEYSRKAYEKFGSVVSFDATYQTNKYNLICVPFTGVDNHNQSISFGAALILNETAATYSWLLKSFLKAHINQPVLVLTDQDPAMAVAIREVWPVSRHRYCMWHIMRKLPLKVSVDLLNTPSFWSKLKRLVWSVYIKTETFETRWGELMLEHNLQDHEWLTEMYNLREMWIPSYFRDIHLCCIMRTTSRSESENSSFKVNSACANTLVQFMFCYENRLESQRYNYRRKDFATSQHTFVPQTNAAIERHAFDIYTQSAFRLVAKEITKGYMCCFISNSVEKDVLTVFDVSHMDQRNALVNVFKVVYNEVSLSADYSCMSFTRIGYLCRHVFAVFRLKQINKIPQHYISDRWSRVVLPKSLFLVGNRYGVDTSSESVIRTECFDIVASCLDSIRTNLDVLGCFSEGLKALKNSIFSTKPSQSTNPAPNRDVAVELNGKRKADAEVLQNPPEVRTKGRLRVSKVKAKKFIQLKSRVPKVRRHCKKCDKWVLGHDSRNCDKMTDKEKEQAAQAALAWNEGIEQDASADLEECVESDCSD